MHQPLRQRVARLWFRRWSRSRAAVFHSISIAVAIGRLKASVLSALARKTKTLVQTYSIWVEAYALFAQVDGLLLCLCGKGASTHKPMIRKERLAYEAQEGVSLVAMPLDIHHNITLCVGT